MKKKLFFKDSDEKIEVDLKQYPFKRRVTSSGGHNITYTSRKWHIESISNKHFSFNDKGRLERYRLHYSDKTSIKING